MILDMVGWIGFLRGERDGVVPSLHWFPCENPGSVCICPARSDRDCGYGNVPILGLLAIDWVDDRVGDGARGRRCIGQGAFPPDVRGEL